MSIEWTRNALHNAQLNSVGGSVGDTVSALQEDLSSHHLCKYAANGPDIHWGKKTNVRR